MEQLVIFIVIIYCENNRVRRGPEGKEGTTGFKTGLFYGPLWGWKIVCIKTTGFYTNCFLRMDTHPQKIEIFSWHQPTQYNYSPHNL
jgi:hypothetical protein